MLLLFFLLVVACAIVRSTSGAAGPSQFTHFCAAGGERESLKDKREPLCCHFLLGRKIQYLQVEAMPKVSQACLGGSAAHFFFSSELLIENSIGICGSDGIPAGA